MSHLGLAINPQTNDLFLSPSGDLAVVTDAQAIGQHVRQRLMTFNGEWFLDSDAGVPWIGDLLGGRYNPALAESVVKAEIMNTDGVTGIDGFSVSFERSKRRLDINDIEVETIYGEVTSV